MDQFKLLLQAAIDLQKSKNSINSQINKLQEEAKKLKIDLDVTTAKKTLKQFSKEYQEALKIKKENLDQNISTYLKINSKLSKSLREEFIKLQQSLESVDNVKSLANISKQLSTLKLQAKQLGQEGENFSGSIKENISKFSQWFFIGGAVSSSVSSIKDMVKYVVELDNSLVELRKVSDLSGQSLVNFTNKAYNMGLEIARTGKEVIDATTVFKRAGYTLDESFDLAKASLVMVNVGDGIRDVNEASSALIATLKGFKLSDTDAMKVVDMINETSNTAAIDFENITEGLRRVSGTLSQAGTSIEETIGLLTGGFSSLRDIEMVSSGLIMISQRLRGIGEDGKEIDGLAPKLKKDFKEIANIDIEDANGNLRSTYDILSDMAKVFPTLTSEQRQYLGELAAGNRQIKVLNAIVDGWNDVTNATNSALNSQGSALEENEKVLDSIQGKINAFQSEFQKLSINTVDSDFIKFFVDLATSILKTTNAVGGLIPVLTTATIIFGGYKLALKALLTTTEEKTLANLALTVSEYGLAASIKSVTAAIKSFLLTNPLGWAVGAVSIVSSVIAIYDAFTVSIKEQKQALETANTAYEESKTELESINNELKTTQQRIDELNAKDNLTFVEQGELEKLQDITKELLIQQDILEKRNLIDAKKLAEEAVNTFNDQFGNTPISNSQIEEYRRTIDYSDESNLILLDEKNNVSSLIAAYKQFSDLKQEAFNDKNNELAQGYNKILDGISESLNNNISDLTDLQTKLKSVPFDELTDDQKQALEEINQAIELIYTNIDPNRWKEIKFTEVFNSPSMKTVKKELEELAKAGELTPEVLTSTSKYRNLLDQTGLTAEEVAKHINGTVEVIEEVSNQIGETKPKILSLSDALINLSDNAKLIDDLKDEFKEIGTISTDSINKIINAYPQLESVVSEFLLQKIDEKELFQELNNAYQTDVDNYRNAILEKKSLDEEFYKDVVDNLPDWVKDLADSYQVDFENYKNLQEAKLDIYQKYAEQIAKVESLLVQDTQESYEDAILRTTKFVSPLSKIVSELETSIDTELNLKGYTPSPSKKKEKKETDSIKEAFEKEYNLLKYHLDKQIITEEKYYDALEALNKKYYANKKKYLDEFRRYDVEVFKGRQKLEEERLKELEKLEEERYKNLFKDNNRRLSSIKNDKQDILNAIEEIEAANGKASQKQYEDLIKLSNEEIKLYQQRKKIAEEELSKTDVSSDRYDELRDVIQSCEDAISDARVSQLGWNKTILEMPISHLERANESLQKSLDRLENLRDDYDSVISAVVNSLEDEIESVNKAKDVQAEFYDNIIKAKQEELEAFKKTNDERQREFDLQQKQYELERLKNQKTRRVYREGIGFTYETDSNAIRQAQHELDKLAYDNIIKTKEQEIDALEKAKESALKSYDDQIEKLDAIKKSWTEIADTYERLASIQLADNLLGFGWQDRIANGGTKDFNLMERIYGDTERQIRNIQAQIERNNQVIKSVEEYIKAWQQAEIDITEAHEEIQKVISDTKEETKATEERVELAVSYAEQWEITKDTVNEALDLIIEGHNIARDKEYEILEQRLVNMRTFADELKKLAQECKTYLSSIQSNLSSAKNMTSELRNIQSNTLNLNANNTIPKYHRGMELGYIGEENKKDVFKLLSLEKLKPNEIPIIAEKKEALLTEIQQDNILSNILSSYKAGTIDGIKNITLKQNSQPNFSFTGDIHLHEVQNVDQLSDAVVNEFIPKVNQKLHSRG